MLGVISQSSAAMVDTMVGAMVDAMMDATVDAIVDAIVNTMVGAMVDAMVDAMVGAMYDALVDTIVDAMVGELHQPKKCCSNSLILLYPFWGTAYLELGSDVRILYSAVRLRGSMIIGTKHGVLA